MTRLLRFGRISVIPRQPGSDWGIGPPQLAVFEDAGRATGTKHDASSDEQRHQRAQADALPCTALHSEFERT
jgi:hypothetical protein